jgi:RHS repeat-associated protein
LDANGNRQTTAASTYTTGTDNQIASDGTYTYTYDADGNRTSRTSIADGSVTDYTWDYRNRLTEVTSKTSTGQITQQVQYAYDYQNRLVREVINPGTADQQKTVYVYDGDQTVLEFDGTADATTSDPPLAAANLTHRYLWAQATDQLLADEQVSSLTQPGNVLWALTDDLGTVRDLAEYNAATQTTSIVNHQVFSAFGQLESQTNLSNPQAAAVDCLFGFTGQLFDTATGLQNNLNRWYDPATGTWLSQDPIGFAAGDANLQRYIGNGPTYQTDPTGNVGTDGPMNPTQPMWPGGPIPANIDASTSSVGFTLTPPNSPQPTNGLWGWSGSQWIPIPPACNAAQPQTGQGVPGQLNVQANQPSGWLGTAGNVALHAGAGLAQGGANLGEAVTKTVIGIGNLVPGAWNITGGWFLPNCPYIPNPSWAYNIVPGSYETPTTHAISVGAGEVAIAAATIAAAIMPPSPSGPLTKFGPPSWWKLGDPLPISDPRTGAIVYPMPGTGIGPPTLPN